MRGVCVDGPNSPPVQSAAEMVGRFQGEVISALPGWQARLTDHPEQLEELERDVQGVFHRGAGLLVAGLLAVVMKQPAFDTACEETRQGFAYPLATGRMRQIRLRLLGGLIIWVSSLYCAPRKSWFGRTQAKAPGAYIELAQFGFGKGCSPGLQSPMSLSKRQLAEARSANQRWPARRRCVRRCGSPRSNWSVTE